MIYLQDGHTNSFQGIIITDHIFTYAVFIYECGGMGWGGGIIGWQYNTTTFQTNPLNLQSDNNRIGCLYSSTYSAIVYRLSKSHRIVMLLFVYLLECVGC